MKRIYLDYAASTPLAPEVATAMEPYFSMDFGNAHALHEEGRRARSAIEAARDIIADAIGAKGDELIFTSSGTESNSMAIFGTLDHIYEERGTLEGTHVITSAIEHPSVLDVFRALERRGVETSYIGVDREGILKVDELERAITPKTVLVSVMYANNEIGTIQPIAHIGSLIAAKRTGSYPYFHTDASQAPLFAKLDVKALGVDLLSIDAQKLYGPKGVGGLYLKRGVTIVPRFIGGRQERGLRPGTVNTPGVVGFGAAYELAEERREDDIRQVGGVRDYFLSSVETSLPSVYLNGSRRERLANNLNFSFPGIEGEYVAVALDERGVAVSTKSACLADGGEGSYVIAALDRSRAKHSVRFTLGRETTRDDIDYTVSQLVDIVEAFQRQ